MAAAAVLAGARSMTAIAEWAADTPQSVRAALGARRGLVWVGDGGQVGEQVRAVGFLEQAGIAQRSQPPRDRG